MIRFTRKPTFSLLVTILLLFLEVDQYRMMSVGVSDQDTELEFSGGNLICNATNNLIPKLARIRKSLLVSQFQFESIGFLSEISTLVVCGGTQTSDVKQLDLLFYFFFIIKNISYLIVLS